MASQFIMDNNKQTSHQKIQLQCKSLEPQYLPKIFKLLGGSDAIVLVFGIYHKKRTEK